MATVRAIALRKTQISGINIIRYKDGVVKLLKTVGYKPMLLSHIKPGLGLLNLTLINIT